MIPRTSLCALLLTLPLAVIACGDGGESSVSSNVENLEEDSVTGANRSRAMAILTATHDPVARRDPGPPVPPAVPESIREVQKRQQGFESTTSVTLRMRDIPTYGVFYDVEVEVRQDGASYIDDFYFDLEGKAVVYSAPDASLRTKCRCSPYVFEGANGRRLWILYALQPAT